MLPVHPARIFIKYKPRNQLSLPPMGGLLKTLSAGETFEPPIGTERLLDYYNTQL